jgi:hypothetical protein
MGEGRGENVEWRIEEIGEEVAEGNGRRREGEVAGEGRERREKKKWD